ncbi:MAG: SpoIID/LytB domain-containing protein [Myxococcaceae bacterium]
MRAGLSLALVAMACASGISCRSTPCAAPASTGPHAGQSGPRISIRLMEGAEEVSFSARGPVRLRTFGPKGKTLEAPAGALLRVRRLRAYEAVLRYSLQLGEFSFEDKASLVREQADWERKGLAVRVHVVGSVYAIGGKVIDNRRALLLLEGNYDAAEPALARRDELLRAHGVHTSLFEEPRQRASGVLELLDDTGAPLTLAEGRIEAETLDGAGFDVRNVEFDVGYVSHGFEDRSYRGALQLTFDRQGKIAVVNLVFLEQLLYGLVPAEIFPQAHPEALKAQAVSARGEVLAKIGVTHLGDPYQLCSEQHCAVYKGLSSEKTSTTAAVDATRGEGLFGAGGRLVDSVYSASCGGHSENNDVVWGEEANPDLRGRPDLIGPTDGAPSPNDLPSFLEAFLPAACRLATLANPAKYRWERRFTAQEVDAFAEPLQIGRVHAITVDERGVSGRARLLTLAGESGTTQLHGELNIRRFFGMLNSALFLVSAERDDRGEFTGWVFRGGGWGHGVGMCQTGAIGRAEAGQSYRAILEHYFSGAQVSRLY